MNKLILLFGLTGFLLNLSAAKAAHPPYNCAAEEMRSVLYNKDVYPQLMTSGRILSVAALANGYRVITEKCVADISLNYLPGDGMAPCLEFNVKLENILCKS